MGEEVDPQDLRRQQRHPEAEEWPGQHDEDLGDPSGQSVPDEAANVVVHPSAFLHGGDHGGEVVVGEDQIGCLLRHLGTPSPHRDADVGDPQRGGVVHPVSGHRHDVPVGLPAGDDVELLFGNRARVHRPPRRRGLGQVMTGQHLLVGGEDAEPASNRRGGRGMITGDDHRDDAGGACCGDRW